MSADGGIKAQETTVGGLFASGEVLSLPPYQRSFSWLQDDVAALISDLSEAQEHDRIHFIGAIVVVGRARARLAEIIDGQQRLTTLTILLCVLRDLLKGTRTADQLHRLVETPGRHRSSDDHPWRLTLNALDRAFFEACIQTPGATLHVEEMRPVSESQTRLVGAANQIRHQLRGLSERDLVAFADYVSESCVLVRVKVEGRDRGHSVFRVLNARGQQPYAHDIIKTELFERARLSAEEAEEFGLLWLGYEQRLGPRRFDELLRAIRQLHPNQKGDLVFQFRHLFGDRNASRRFLERDLGAYVTAFEDVCARSPGDKRGRRPIDRHLDYLEMLDHEGWRAIGIQFLFTERSEAEKLAFFKSLERLAFFLQIVVPNPSERRARYGRVLAQIMSDDSVEAMAANLSGLGLSETERTDFANRLTGKFSNVRLRRTLVFRVNALLPNGEHLRSDADATVEHVLPRKPEERSDWLVAWSDITERQTLTETLGNMVLLSKTDNQKLGRQDYADKHRMIFASPRSPVFAITRDIEGIRAWTPQVVVDRTERLVGLLRDCWEL